MYKKLLYFFTLFNILYNSESTCNSRTYNSTIDFSGTQGSNGWYYGYNNSGTFSQLLTYINSGTTNSDAWFYDINDWTQISQNIIIPSMFGSGGGGFCSDITSMAPVLKWIQPVNLCYQDVTISVSLTPTSGIGASLTVNDDVLYLNSNLTTTYTNTFNVYNVFSVQLEIDPSNNGCNDPQTTYSIVITPIVNTISSINTLTMSRSTVNTMTPTSTCAYRTYNANTDFSNIQGTHGWYYGYYASGTFTQFGSYGISSTGSVGSVNSWNYNTASNGIISSTMIMQNGANSCNTASYGNIAPVLRWYNPNNSCYQDITIHFTLSGNSNSAGSIVSLTVNGVSIYSLNGIPNVNNYFNAYGVHSVELSIGPINNNCDYGQMTYSLNIAPMIDSFTAAGTRTSSVSPSYSISPKKSFSTTQSNTVSGSVSVSNNSSASIIGSSSPPVSRSQIASATATATVFYLGNWTDFGQYNYAMADIVSYYDMTIYQCQLRCWLNQLCGLIVVETPCTTISLTDPAIYTTACNVCWLKLTSGWIISASSGSKSIMLYDRVYPPTTTSITTYSPTASAIATSTLVTYSTLNFCSNSGRTITLPFVGSSIYIMTNAIGGQYTNNAACSINIYGAGNSQLFRINISSFTTEACCDFFTVYDSNNNIVARYSNNVASGTNFIANGPHIQITFTSDGSVVSSGVFAIISLDYASTSASPSLTSSSSSTKSSSYSPLPSSSSFKSYTISYSSLNSKSSSKSASISSSGLLSDSLTSSVSISSSSLPSNSPTSSASISNSPIKTTTSSLSDSTLPTISSKSTSTFSNSQTSTLSPISSSTLSTRQSNTPSPAPSQTFSSSPTYSPTPINLLPFKLPPKDDNYNSAVTNQLNNYLSDLLLNGGTLPPALALSVINTIPQVGIADTMNVLKKLGGVISAPISFSSTSFEGALAPIKNTTVEVSSISYNINIPVIPNLPPNSAVVAISWSNTTTFSNETTLSNIMSISVSNKGVDHTVKNLTSPVVLNWNISNIVTPPNMTLKCSYWNYTSSSWRSDGCNITIVNNILNCECDHMTDFVARFERIAEMNKNMFENAGNVYSLDGLNKYKNYYIFYGCYFILMMLVGIVLQQLDIKNSEQYLQSLKQNFDIIKFKKEIKNFYIDKCYINDDIDEFDEYNEYKMYKYKLINDIYNKIDKNKFNNKKELFEYIQIFIDEELEKKHLSDINSKLIIDSDSSDNSEHKNKSFISNTYTIITLWWKRLLYQHNYLSILFKYDPQSPRIFRVFFIFTVISHTLFMTALLYGYTHSISGSIEETSPIMAIVLSVITSLINVPFMNFIMNILQLSGKAEFEWRYPFIYREIKKMIIFEDVYYNKKNTNKKSNTSEIVEDNDDDKEDIITSFLINYLYRYVTCCKRTDKNVILDKDQIFRNRIDNEIIKIKDIPLDSEWWYTYYLPFHTCISTLSFFGCLGYLIWTINYLLLFSASTQPDVQISIMQSFGISQLFSIFVMTPITLLMTLLFTWAYHKYIKKTSFISNVIPLYFHSDPFVNDKSFGLTVRLTKSLFLKSIAESSINQPTDPRIIAPPKGLIAQLLKEDISNYMDKEYYDKIVKYETIYKSILD
jgi:hypothetical protein